MVLAFKGTKIAPVKNGANRWINIGGIEFQPSEIAKFALILMFAHFIALYGSKMKTFRFGFLPFMGILVVIAGLVFLESHVSATLIICLIAVLMMFIGGTKMRYFVAIGVIGGVALACVLLFSDKFAYAMDRIYGWLDPFNPPEGVDTWQTVQSLYAIGSGGIFGKGLGNSAQKLGTIPEAQNDMIFSIICEELGIFGAALVLLLFGYMLYRLFFIAQNACDLYGSMIAIGIMAHIALQVVLNICVASNLIPTTGITLPFISYGGTSVLFLMMEMALALSVSRRIEFSGDDRKEEEQKRLS